jgi:hypothetical protein
MAALLPVLLTDGFRSGSDAYTYCAFADWLQGHGFSERAVWDPLRPLTYIPWLYQHEGYALGISYLLALVAAAARAPTALVVYPAVAAWGVVLFALAVFVAARWVLRLPAPWSGTAALAFAIVPGPVYWGHHEGFLQQTYALPVLLLAACVLSRAAASRRFDLPTAFALALLSAFLVTVYVPVLPLLAAAAAGALALAARPARRHIPWRRAGGFLGAGLLAFGAFTFDSLAGVLRRFTGYAESTVGEHVRLGALDVARFALGTRVVAPHQQVVDPGWAAPVWSVAAVAAAALAAIGFVALAPRRRAWPLLAVVALLAAAVLRYAWFARDPWTGALGHTWNLFKLAQWAYPLLLLLAAGGAPPALRAARGARWIAVPLAGLLAASAPGLHGAWSVALGMTMRESLPDRRPLSRVPGAMRALQSLPGGPLVALARPASRGRWIAAHLFLLSYPRSLAGDWSDSASIAPNNEAERASAELLARIGEPGVLPLLSDYTPFQPGGASPVGPGLALLDPSAGPMVLHVVSPSGMKRDAGGSASFEIGAARARVIVWSPGDAAAELELDLAPYPPLPGARRAIDLFVAPGDTTRAAIRAAVARGRSSRVPLDGASRVRLPIGLARGLSTVLLEPVPARQPVVATGVRITPGPRDR